MEENGVKPCAHIQYLQPKREGEREEREEREREKREEREEEGCGACTFHPPPPNYLPALHHFQRG